MARRGRGRRRRHTGGGTESRRAGPADLSLEIDLPGALDEYDISEKVRNRLEKQGLLPSKRPTDKDGNEYDGTIPKNLTQLDQDELGEWLSLTTRWCEYTGDLLAEAEMADAIAKEQKRATLRFLRKKLEEDRKPDEGEGKKYLDDDEVETNPIFVQVNATFLQVVAYKKFCTRAYEAAENNRRSISHAIRAMQKGGGGVGRETNVLGKRGGSFRRKRKS